MTLPLRLLLYAALIWGALVWFGRASRFYPQHAPSEMPSGAELVTIPTPDGERLQAWWFPVTGSPLTTLYLHGNGGYLAVYTEHLLAIRQAGQSLLIIDYRGYGQSTGTPSEDGLYLDAQAGYDWLRRRGYRGEQVIVQGLSLGTAVAVDLSTKNKVGGVVLEAPLPSARAVAADILPVLGWTLPLGFDSRAKIPALRAPLLVLHGDRDRVIDLSLGRDLFAAAPQPKEFVVIPGAGHDDLPMVAGPNYPTTLRRFYLQITPELH